MKPNELIIEIETVQQKVNIHLENRKNGISGPGTEGELTFILDELSVLIQSLKKGEIPPEDQRWLSSPQIITETWDFDEPLGEEILDIDYLYKHELDNSQ